MSASAEIPLQRFIERSLELFAAKLSESDRQLPPEALARLFVHFATSPEFWDEDMKTFTADALIPFIQKWIRGE